MENGGTGDLQQDGLRRVSFFREVQIWTGRVESLLQVSGPWLLMVSREAGTGWR